MSKSTRSTFLVHMVVSLVVGFPLLIIPGRLLQLFDWAPIDPLISRCLGAAFLALAWSSYRGWRAQLWQDAALIVELEALFAVLATIGLLRHLLVASWPLVVWVTFAVFALFAAGWIVALFRK